MTTLAAIAKLKTVLPPSAWSEDQDIISPHVIDWRQRVSGATPILLTPGNREDVQQAVRICAEHRIPIVPQGGNTGLVAGGIPGIEQTEILLSLSRMISVDAANPANMTIKVGAGATLQAVQNAAKEAGLLFPLSLASEGTCSIGGNIATNAGGVHVIKYGTMQALVTGIEAVLPSGELYIDNGNLVKNNTGYNLTRLLCGSEGTLGIITAATLKLFPQPKTKLSAWLGFNSMQQAIDIFMNLRHEFGDQIAAFEIMPSAAMAFLDRHLPHAKIPIETDTPWHALVDIYSMINESSLQNQFIDWYDSNAVNRDGIKDRIIGVMATNQREMDAFWRLRESFPDIQKREGYSIKHDIALPLDQIAAFTQEMLTELQQLCPGVRPVPFGHLGDGNLHFNLTCPVGMKDADFKDMAEDLTACIFGEVHKRGGTISAEHGIGLLRKGDLKRYKMAADLKIMRDIKQAIDPHNLFNPGRIFDL